MSLTIDCQNRVITGHAVRKLRREGLIPAVIYGGKTASKYIQANLNEMVKILKVSGKREVITLNIEGTKIDVKVIQADIHPVKGTFRHLDFIIV
jgi:large subunit ribosomal protein L25